MHEMSVVAGIRDRALEHLPPRTRAVEVVVEVGALEHLDDEVMELAWEAATHEPALRGAALRIEHVPVRVRCLECGREHAPDHRACLLCPACGRSRPEVLEGLGVLLRSLEAEPLAPAPSVPQATAAATTATDDPAEPSHPPTPSLPEEATP